MKKSIALVAMCATALSPVLSTAAYADTILDSVVPAAADSATLADMQQQCDAIAAGFVTNADDIWSGEVVAGAVTLVSGPTETGGRVIDESTIQHAGDYVPATLEIRGDPFRIGGSVNMFGEQWSTAGYWTDSTYEFDAEFESTFAHAFQCAVMFEKYHPEQFIPGHPVQGYYIVEPTDQGNEEAAQNSCNAFTALGPTWEHWGDDHAQCDFVKTADATEDETIPAYHDPAVQVASVGGTPVNQTQSDTLHAFEDHGGPVQVTGEYYVGNTVICISPSTTSKKGVPGVWRTQNGYTGTKCTTDWFAVAPWGAGATTSQGTYKSVPDYTL